MKTADAIAIGRAIGKIERTLDAWEESKHRCMMLQIWSIVKLK